MNTLQEIAAFVGIGPRMDMRSVGDRVPLLGGAERTSMQAMIAGLQKLPGISLNAEPVGNRFGDVPFAPVFRIHPSNGVVLETRMTIFANGPQPEESVEVGGSGDFSPITLRFVGMFFLQVTRTGIQSTGMTTLALNFHVEGVAPPPPPPPHVQPPFIAVQSKGDGSFVVSGSGFLPNAPVYILVGDATFRNPLVLTDTSTPQGKLAGFPTSKICQGPGQLYFSANDGRLDPANHATLTSNTVKISCPS